MDTHARRMLLEIFDAALRAVDGRACVRRALRARTLPATLHIIAVGKAAASMTLGALDVLGARVRQALVVTKDGHGDPALTMDSRVTVLESAHPVPDARSLAAGVEVERRLRELPVDDHPLFLVSGGSSSLVEHLHEGVTLDELRALNQRGLSAGWDIAQLNAERARRSRLKGGGVARLLAGREATALFLSDVPGDDPGVIGSGLLGPALGLADRIDRDIIASVDTAVQAACQAATTLGFELQACEGRFSGEASQVARTFVERLRACPGDGLVWGGESTVTLPAHPGRGGRNQHLALLATRLLPVDEGWTLLAAGTDGTDGPTADAGAVVDSGTRERAEIAGIDVDRALAQFDSGTVLECTGDLVFTGPTGTNVGDLLIGLRPARGSLRDLARLRVL
jgi:glycerate 2-kinase